MFRCIVLGLWPGVCRQLFCPLSGQYFPLATAMFWSFAMTNLGSNYLTVAFSWQLPWYGKRLQESWTNALPDFRIGLQMIRFVIEHRALMYVMLRFKREILERDQLWHFSRILVALVLLVLIVHQWHNDWHWSGCSLIIVWCFIPFVQHRHPDKIRVMPVAV